MRQKKYFVKNMLELYKDLIIDHGMNPRNKFIITNYTHKEEGFNFFCGDSFTLYANIINNNIFDISFDGKGCSISVASASILTSNIKKKNIHDVFLILNYFNDIIHNNNTKIKNEYYEINTLTCVKKFPPRVKCATLIWHTLKNMLKNKEYA